MPVETPNTSHEKPISSVPFENTRETRETPLGTEKKTSRSKKTHASSWLLQALASKATGNQMQ
jgi:hypothetical protein